MMNFEASDYVLDARNLELGRGLSLGLEFHRLMKEDRSTVSHYDRVVKFINNKTNGDELPSLYKNKKNWHPCTQLKARRLTSATVVVWHIMTSHLQMIEMR